MGFFCGRFTEIFPQLGASVGSLYKLMFHYFHEYNETNAKYWFLFNIGVCMMMS